MTEERTRRRDIGYGPLLLIAAVFVGILLAFSVYTRLSVDHQAAQREAARLAREQAYTCERIDKLDGVIVALLQRSQKTLPTQPYYKMHPELLPAAQRENRRAIHDFQGAAC